MKKANKFFSVLLALIMTLSIIPMSSITVSAAETSGTCGENLTWTFDESTGTLTISGTGEMDNYNSSNRPWQSYADSLKKVIINNGVTTICDFAFFNCKSLTNVKIPDGVLSIGSYAFYMAWNIDSMVIPASVIRIGEGTFDYCGAFIAVDSNNQHYYADMYGVLFNKDKTMLIKYPSSSTLSSYSVPDGVKTICDNAFDNSQLADIELPDSIITIGDLAFFGCHEMKNIVIPASVTSIGVRVFESCTALESITVDNDNEHYSCDSYGVLFNKDKTTLIQYSTGSSRKNYIIPNGVENICEYAFAYSDFTSISIPDSVKKISNRAFYCCPNLTSITIPNSVVEINTSAFSECWSLTTATLSESITSIDFYLFENCRSLVSVTIPNGVTRICVSAFSNCKKLTDVYYSGVEAQWNTISIGSLNEPLINATIHFLGDEHTCTFGDWITVTESTCTEVGFKKQTCSCGVENTAEAPALGHDFETEFTRDEYACEGDYGWQSRHCTRCDATTDGKPIHNSTHTMSDTWRKGEYLFACIGYYYKDCLDCTYNIKKEDDMHGPLGWVEIEPTCTQDGYGEWICSFCVGPVSDRTIIPATGHSFVNGVCETCGEQDPNYVAVFTFSIQEPSRTTIRYKDGIILHANVEGNLPDGARIEWSADNSKFKVEKASNGNKITIISNSKGYTVFTAKVIDANGNELASDTVEMYSKAGFFDIIGGFFRSIFGLDKIYEN